MSELPELVVREWASLVDCFAALRNHLQLSNESCEELAGLCAGHVDKVLGPTRVKNLSPWLFDLFCQLFAVEFHAKVDLTQARKMESRWERRDKSQIRPPARLSKAILDRARPIILSEMARRGWETRKRQAQQNGQAAA